MPNCILVQCIKSPNAVEYALFIFVSFSSIRISKRQKLSGVAYRKFKATRECVERKLVVSLHIFRQKKYVAKAKRKDEDAKCTSELREEEHGENGNMVKTNIEMKVEEQFRVGIKVVKGENDDVPNEETFSACGNLLSFLLRCGTRPYELGTQ